MVDHSTHECQQFQTHDRRRCGTSSEIPSAGVSLPIAGVAVSHRQRPSVGPSTSTQVTATKNKYGQSILDALWDSQPMKVPEQ